MGPVGIKVYHFRSQHEEANFGSQEVTVAPYDPFSQGEQVYLGSMDIELSFTKPNYRTDFEFDSDALAKFFIMVPNPRETRLT
jgi:hypothetical protein